MLLTEVSPEDWNMVIERDGPYQAERAMYPKKYPKYVLRTCMLQGELPKLTEGFRIVEVFEYDNPEQLANHMASWDAQRLYAKTLKRWYIPLVEYEGLYSKEYNHQRELLEKTMKEQSMKTQ